MFPVSYTSAKRLIAYLNITTLYAFHLRLIETNLYFSLLNLQRHISYSHQAGGGRNQPVTLLGPTMAFDPSD
jgi:hypothetical protein